MEPRDLTATEAADKIRSGALSPVTLMESLLERIRVLEPLLKAWAALDEKAALAAAQEAERSRAGHRVGLLHGVPTGVKDIFYTAGMPTEAGAAQYAGFVPAYDATSVARLKEAGAIILGKAVCTQFGARDYAATVSPWHPDHTPGASSVGSAVVVAAGMCPIALGSQTGGSTLRPAAYNGIVGMTATYGRISKYGIVPLARSIDTVGVLVRSVADAALVLQVIAGHDPNDLESSSAPVGDYIGAVSGEGAPPRIGVVREFFYDHAAPEMRAHTDAVVDRLRGAGAGIAEASLPETFEAHETARGIVQRVEIAAFHQEMFQRDPNSYRENIRRGVEAGLPVPGVDYARAQELRQRFSSELNAIASEFDILLTPATPSIAPPDRTDTGPSLFQGGITSAGLPSIAIPSGTLPLGIDGTEMPVGIQLVGARFAEERMLAAARWCEQVLDVKLTPVAPHAMRSSKGVGR